MIYPPKKVDHGSTLAAIKNLIDQALYLAEPHHTLLTANLSICADIADTLITGETYQG